MAAIDPRDYVAICDVKARSCRMIDTKDWEGYAALLTDDFELDMTSSGGKAVIHGREDAIASVSQALATIRTVHQVHLPEIETDGDTARAIFPMQDRVLLGEGRGSITGYGHYHERYTRRDGRWLLTASQLTRLHVDMFPPA